MKITFNYEDRPLEPNNASEDPAMWAELAVYYEDLYEEAMTALAEISRAGASDGVLHNDAITCVVMRSRAEAAIKDRVFIQEEQTK